MVRALAKSFVHPDCLERRHAFSSRVYSGSVGLVDWPAWWQWELALSRHLFERMDSRGFTEIELRAMMEMASGLHPEVRNRWAIESRWRGVDWEVIVEPDPVSEHLVVITAYPVDEE